MNLKPNIMTEEITMLEKLAFFQRFIKEEGHTPLQIAMANEAITAILIKCN